MHPLFNTSKKLLILSVSWSVLAASICGLISAITDYSLLHTFILFAPLYLLCVLFILPNFYVCRGLPLGQTEILLLAVSQLLTVMVVVVAWMLIGQSYANYLEGASGDIPWRAMFTDTLFVNLTLIAIQYEIIVLIHYLFFALEKSKDLERVALEQKLLISQAELQSLKATVHPHFLFNALNTLSSIALSEPEKAHRFCLLMAEFLRYSVGYNKKESATMREELEHIRNYLGIERERFGKRLQTRFDVDDSVLSQPVPPLILFPIIENAIKHGIDSCLEGGVLSVEVKDRQDTLFIQVTNPVDELGKKKKGEGHGLSSVERRLEVRYDKEALLKTIKESGKFTVQIYIPLQDRIVGNLSQ